MHGILPAAVVALAAAPVAAAFERHCDDRSDNDGDGLEDCLDPDCVADAECVDSDQDGLNDAYDFYPFVPDSAHDPTPGLCTDMADDVPFPVQDAWDVEFGPDGWMVYADPDTGVVYRVRIDPVTGQALAPPETKVSWPPLLASARQGPEWLVNDAGTWFAYRARRGLVTELFAVEQTLGHGWLPYRRTDPLHSMKNHARTPRGSRDGSTLLSYKVDGVGIFVNEPALDWVNGHDPRTAALVVAGGFGFVAWDPFLPLLYLVSENPVYWDGGVPQIVAIDVPSAYGPTPAPAPWPAKPVTDVTLGGGAAPKSRLRVAAVDPGDPWNPGRHVATLLLDGQLRARQVAVYATDVDAGTTSLRMRLRAPPGRQLAWVEFAWWEGAAHLVIHVVDGLGVAGDLYTLRVEDSPDPGVPAANAVGYIRRILDGTRPAGDPCVVYDTEWLGDFTYSMTLDSCAQGAERGRVIRCRVR